MKPIICTLILAAGALALHAQPQGGAAPAGNQVLFRQQQDTPSQAQTDKQLATEINKLSKKLKLSETQKAELSKLYTDANEQLRKLDQQRAQGGQMMGGGMMGARPQGAVPAMPQQASRGASSQAAGPAQTQGAPGQGAQRPQTGQGAPTQGAQRPQAGQGAPAQGAQRPQAGQGAPAQGAQRPQAGQGNRMMMMGRGMQSGKGQIEEARNTAVKELLDEDQLKKYERYLRVKAANSGGGMGMGMGGM